MSKYRVTGYLNVHVFIDEEVESDSSLNATRQAYSMLNGLYDSGKIMDCDLDAQKIKE